MTKSSNKERAVQVASIVFREDLYPRIETNPVVVQKYAEDLEVLPPIEINQRNELIDGWHRWTAHRKKNAETIQATVTETASDVELLELANERNAKHGMQLSQQDKKSLAVKIYAATPEANRDDKKAHLAKILSVTLRSVQSWVSDIDKESKRAQVGRIFSLWMACYTQEEIAEREGVTRTTVTAILSENENFRKLTKADQAAAGHATDFDIPIYNIWTKAEKTPGSSIYGNSEVRWVDNLLYLYTEPFDVVVDPFAGGGSTIDICRKRFRRYWASDRKPLIEREKDIRLHDLTTGLPPLPRWQDVALVYLDPPYWKQAEGEYSKDPTDLANMELPAFNKTLAGIICGFAAKPLKPDAAIALIIQPTQWRAPEKQYTDHIIDMVQAATASKKLRLHTRISCPYSTQQYTPQMVDWAKENKELLVLTRELVVWKVR